MCTPSLRLSTELADHTLGAAAKRQNVVPGLGWVLVLPCALRRELHGVQAEGRLRQFGVRLQDRCSGLAGYHLTVQLPGEVEQVRERWRHVGIEAHQGERAQLRGVRLEGDANLEQV